MYTSYVKPWGDDVSGNRSKQYNAHTNIYFCHANIPHTLLAQEYFVQFCSTSPHATASEQFNAFAEVLKYVLINLLIIICISWASFFVYRDENNWQPAYDCNTGEEILFRVLSHNFPADNPQQSETCSHIGLKGNFWCRKCYVGGTESVIEPFCTRTKIDTYVN